MTTRKLALFALLWCWLLGCAAAPGKVEDPLQAARSLAPSSDDGEVVGRWLLLEMVAPGGQPTNAQKARSRLDQTLKPRGGLYASLSRAVDAEAHGRLSEAFQHYTEVLDAARTFQGAEADLVAHFATLHLLRLRPSAKVDWSRHEALVASLLDAPTRIGFRARSDITDWWTFEARRQGKLDPGELESVTRSKLGCITQARLAGPFGGPRPLDMVTAFEAEAPGVWPSVFAQDPRRMAPPRILAQEPDTGCAIRAAGAVQPGVHYVESFIELDQPSDLILAVQAAWSLRVDDVVVLERDPRAFGVWPRFGVAMRLSAGRHRIVARIGAPETSIRVLDTSGRPLPVRASIDPSAPYTHTPPTILPDPNPLAPFQRLAGAPDQPGWRLPSPAVDVDDPILRFVASELASADGQQDMASVLLEPLVQSNEQATGLALATQAAFVGEDAIFSPADANDLALDLRRRAVKKDARLWYARLWLLLDAAGKSGPKDQLKDLSQLAVEFPEVPFVGRALAELYGRLGYKPERNRTIVDLANRFPDDTETLRQKLSVQDETGDRVGGDATVAAIRGLEPRSTIDVERSIMRGQYAEAAGQLEAKRGAQVGAARASIQARIRELLLRAGKSQTSMGMLEQQLQKDPSERVLLNLADARLASGKPGALREALADAIRRGIETSALRDAIEVVDGMSELETFRVEPLATIREYERSGAAQRGRDRSAQGGGTAARVLDYMAVRIHPDGSARMLEHEILFMQSREAIAEHAEQKIPRGKLLRMRTIKADGTTFEPEVVAGKPTATMPHLELGDYIETETLYDVPGDGRGGKAFVSPRWFFREEKVDYERSEFVVITPKSQVLEVETTGEVPAPKVEERGELVVRSFRIDKSPALVSEPFSARAEEFLPTVRVGWGVSQEAMLERLTDGFTSMIPADPRLVRVARSIATDGAALTEQERALSGVSKLDRARRIYRWVLDNIEPGQENDPRRAIIGKTGSRAEAFLYLTRLVDVDVRPAAVRDRLTPPPRGPFSRAEQFTQLAFAVRQPKADDIWLVVADKNAPFGYLPSSMRGQPAVLLEPGLQAVTTGESGPRDGVRHVGSVVLASDGSAKVTLEQQYTGRLAIELRTAVQTLPEDRLKAAVESKLVADAFPGGRLSSLQVVGLGDLDQPLVLKMEIEVSTFAKRQGKDLILSPPLAVSLAPLVSLPKRETPLVIGHGAAMHVEVSLRVSLPKDAKVQGLSEGASDKYGQSSFAVRDRVEGDQLVFDRVVEIPATRMAPEEYPAFVNYARALDAAVLRDLTVVLP